MGRKSLFERIEDSLAQSIIFMGPMAVGKSLISSKLAKKLGYTYFSLDKCLQYITRLSKDPENDDEVSFRFQFADYLDTFYRMYSEYDKVLFNNSIFQNFNILNSKKYEIPEEISMMVEQAYNLRILQTAVRAILRESFKETVPLIIDANVLIGLNVDCTKFEDIYDETLIKNFGFTRESLNEYINEQIMSFGERILLLPGKDYEKVAASCINNSGNQIVLKNLENMQEVATIVTTVDGVFTDLDNSMFKQDRRNVPISSKKKLLDNSSLNNVVEQLINMMDEKRKYKELS